VRVDELRRAVRVGGVHLRSYQHRCVAERARVEDRRDLADDPLLEQVRDPLEHLLLGEPREAGDHRERPRVQREAALHEVEQLLVGLVERDGGPALAAAHLGNGARRARHVSHPATSFA
jgi:hypothetical protein